MNIFDGIKRTAFATTTNVMGYDCSWVPSDGSAPLDEVTGEPIPQTAKVHYNKPAKEEELSELGSGVDQLGFMPEFHSMEYLRGQLLGLMESVRAGGNEYITLSQYGGTEIGKFQVRQVDPIHDGDTLKADLIPVAEIPQTKPIDEEYVP